MYIDSKLSLLEFQSRLPTSVLRTKTTIDYKLVLDRQDFWNFTTFSTAAIGTKSFLCTTYERFVYRSYWLDSADEITHRVRRTFIINGYQGKVCWGKASIKNRVHIFNSRHSNEISLVFFFYSSTLFPFPFYKCLTLLYMKILLSLNTSTVRTISTGAFILIFL